MYVLGSLAYAVWNCSISAKVWHQLHAAILAEWCQFFWYDATICVVFACLCCVCSIIYLVDISLVFSLFLFLLLVMLIVFFTFADPRTLWIGPFSFQATLSMRQLNLDLVFMPSVLWCCWLGNRTGIRPVQNLSDGVEWHGYLSGVRCRLAYGPADATATHCLLLQ